VSVAVSNDTCLLSKRLLFAPFWGSSFCAALWPRRKAGHLAIAQKEQACKMARVLPPIRDERISPVFSCSIVVQPRKSAEQPAFQILYSQAAAPAAYCWNVHQPRILRNELNSLYFLSFLHGISIKRAQSLCFKRFIFISRNAGLSQVTAQMQARLDNSLQVPNDRAWSPAGLEPRTYYSVALDYFAKPGGNGSSYWVHNPGKQNFLLLDRSPEHVSLHRVFRAASILATASVFTRPIDQNKADRHDSSVHKCRFVSLGWAQNACCKSEVNHIGKTAFQTPVRTGDARLLRFLRTNNRATKLFNKLGSRCLSATVDCLCKHCLLARLH
jgi:hypothetical protein